MLACNRGKRILLIAPDCTLWPLECDLIAPEAALMASCMLIRYNYAAGFTVKPQCAHHQLLVVYRAVFKSADARTAYNAR